MIILLKRRQKKKKDQGEPAHLCSQQEPKKGQRKWDEVPKPNKKKPNGLSCEPVQGGDLS
jgi:hypothetical protein